MEVIQVPNRGRALPEAIQDIVNGGGQIIIPLPKNASLFGVSVRPQEPAHSKTMVNLIVRVNAHPLRAIFLGTGTAYTPDVGTVIGDTPQSVRFAYTWLGDLPLGSDYEYELVANIDNLTGTTRRWIMSAYVGDD